MPKVVKCYTLFVSAHHHRHLYPLVVTKRTRIAYFCSTGNTFFGCYQNNPTGTTHTINGSSSIFQNRDIFNLRRVEHVKCTHIANKTINNVQRLLGIPRTIDTYFYCCIANRVTRGFAHRYARHSTRKYRRQVGRRYIGHFVHINIGHSTCEVGTFHSTITYHYHFVEQFGLFFQNNNCWYGIGLMFNSYIANIRINDGCRWRHFNAILTIKIGNCTRCCAFNHNGCSNNWFAFLVDNATRNGNLCLIGLRFKLSRLQQKSCKQND